MRIQVWAVISLLALPSWGAWAEGAHKHTDDGKAAAPSGKANRSLLADEELTLQTFEGLRLRDHPTAAPGLADVTVDFGTAHERRGAASAIQLSPLPGILARFAADDAQGDADLGVTVVEGVGITVLKVSTESIVTRLNLGGESRFRFHRDKSYDPQAYLRAREIETDPSTRPGSGLTGISR